MPQLTWICHFKYFRIFCDNFNANHVFFYYLRSVTHNFSLGQIHCTVETIYADISKLNVFNFSLTNYAVTNSSPTKATENLSFFICIKQVTRSTKKAYKNEPHRYNIPNWNDSQFSTTKTDITEWNKRKASLFWFLNIWKKQRKKQERKNPYGTNVYISFI